MRGWANDALRWTLGLCLVLLGCWLEVVQRIRILRCKADQARLRDLYDIRPDTPVSMYGADVERSIASKAREMSFAPSYALTSGSTGAPKRLLYPPERVRRARWAFIDAFARSYVRAPFRRHSFYVFSSLHQDGSLTAMMLAEGKRPSYLATLQAPDRLQADPAAGELGSRYGDAALRLWVLCLANPGVLYSTNPSTLSAFLDVMHGDWMRVSALVRDFIERPATLSADVHALARRLESRGAFERLRRVAASDRALALRDIAPAVHTYACWTGGYVRPFLQRLETYLPAPQYRLLPMYSMSTETPETTPYYHGDEVSFIPLAPDVLYEFLPEGAADDPAQLLPLHGLVTGAAYTMVVSDAYGLRRYQTDDLFACVGKVHGLPDLRFLRRRSLSYSFTGEKLTGEQASLALDQLRADFTGVGQGAFLTLMPSASEALPHYWLVVVDPSHAFDERDRAAERCDVILAELNAEYRGKRDSGRLGPMRGVCTTREEFLLQFEADGASTSWEAQFKFLPLYARAWSDSAC